MYHVPLKNFIVQASEVAELLLPEHHVIHALDHAAGVASLRTGAGPDSGPHLASAVRATHLSERP
jgi:hypothetical protein